MEDPEGIHHGELQAAKAGGGCGSQVVGPGSTHPNGGIYKVNADRPIAKIAAATIRVAIREYLHKTNEEVEEATENEKREFERSGIDDIRIEDVVPMGGLRKRGRDEYNGPHPIHGSDTGHNFSVNPIKNQWHCWRHGTGGGPALWIAVQQGIIDCSQARPNILRGEKFKEVLKALGVKTPPRKGKKGKKEKTEDKDKKGIPEEEKDKRPYYIGSVRTGRWIVEEVYNYEEGGFRYLLFDPKTNQKAFLKEIAATALTPAELMAVHIDPDLVEDGGFNCFRPINDEAIRYGSMLLPSDIEECGTTAQLIADIMGFIYKWVDIPPEFLKFSAFYVLMTWVIEAINTVGYLRTIANEGAGKTRYNDAMSHICYRGYQTTGNLTAAPIYRNYKKWQNITLFLDESNWAKTDYHADIIKILNSGIDRRHPIVRCDPEPPFTVRTYPCFGPKIIASREPFKDKALDSRCLTQVMQASYRVGPHDILVDLPKEFFEEALHLRNKCLLWRLRNLDKIDYEATLKIELGEIEPRIQQVSICIAALLTDEPELLAEFKEWLEEQQRQLIEQREATTQCSDYRTVVKYLMDCWPEGFEETGYRGFTSGVIAEIIISDLPIREQETAKKKSYQTRVGANLRAMGFVNQNKRISGRMRRVYDFNEEANIVALIKNARRYLPPEDPAWGFIESLKHLKHPETPIGGKKVLHDNGTSAESDTEKQAENEAATPTHPSVVFQGVSGVAHPSHAEVERMDALCRYCDIITSKEKIIEKFGAELLRKVMKGGWIYEPKPGQCLWEKGHGLPGEVAP